MKYQVLKAFMEGEEFDISRGRVELYGDEAEVVPIDLTGRRLDEDTLPLTELLVWAAQEGVELSITIQRAEG